MRCAQPKNLHPILDGACTANVTLHLHLAVGQLAAVRLTCMLLHLITIPQNHYIDLGVLAWLPNTCSLVQWMRSMHLEVSPCRLRTRANKYNLYLSLKPCKFCASVFVRPSYKADAAHGRACMSAAGLALQCRERGARASFLEVLTAPQIRDGQHMSELHE